MNPADTTFKRRLKTLLVAALAAGCMGYAVGRAARQAPRAAGPGMAPVSRSAGIHAPRTSEAPATPPAASSPAERAAFVAQMQQRLLQMWRASPTITDWELKRDTHRLLSKLTAGELAALYQARDFGPLGDMWLRQAYLTEWALKDGPAAVTQSVKNGEAHNNASSAFSTWAFQNPDEALAWLRDAPLPPSIENSRNAIRVHFLSSFALVNFERVQEELVFMSSKDRAATLSILSSHGPSDPAYVARLTELSKQYADSGGALAVEKSHVANLAQSDPAAALDRISKMDVPAADRVELELAVLRGQARDQPAQAFAGWLARNPSMENLPEPLLPVMDHVFLFDRGKQEMVGWLDALPASPARDAFYEHASRLVAIREDFEKAATYADAISDSTKRFNARKTLRLLWSERNAGAAATWLNQLPEADRQALGRIGDGD